MSEIKFGQMNLLIDLSKQAAERACPGPVFHDRVSAALELSPLLDNVGYDPQTWTTVAIPRGGVPIAGTVAKQGKVHCIFAKKIPLSPEGDTRFGIGAIGPDGGVLLNNTLMNDLDGLVEPPAQEVIDGLQKELTSLERGFSLMSVPQTSIGGRNVAVVDDGISSGLTMLAVCQFLRGFGPDRLLIVSPIAHGTGLERLADAGFSEFCVHTTIPSERPFLVDLYYRDFHPVTVTEMQQHLHLS